MSHGLLEILRYFFLALIWLFFLYAARLVVVEMRRARLEGAGTGELSPIEVRQTEREVRLRLRVLAPETSRGRVVDVEHEATLGRSPACTIPLDQDAFTSSVHARIYRDGGDAWLEDLGSTNGTFVNGEQITAPVPLHRGDEITIGNTIFEVAR